jgi:hypothetical protein
MLLGVLFFKLTANGQGLAKAGFSSTKIHTSTKVQFLLQKFNLALLPRFSPNQC